MRSIFVGCCGCCGLHVDEDDDAALYSTLLLGPTEVVDPDDVLANHPWRRRHEAALRRVSIWQMWRYKTEYDFLVKAMTFHRLPPPLRLGRGVVGEGFPSDA